MKLRNHPLFIYCSLILFFPIGLILLFSSTLGLKHRILGTLCGAIAFISLLSLAFYVQRKPSDLNGFYVVPTRTQLSIGQSGGLAVTNGRDYYADYTVSCNNEDVLRISKNLYTATAAGNCTLTITFQDQTRNVTITVDGNSNTSSTVYITPKGSRYHKTQAHAGKTSVAVSEEDALMSSKTPCAICYG